MQLVTWVNRHKFQVIAGSALFCFMMIASKGAALMAFRALGKFLLPVLVVLLIWSFFKKKLRATLEKSGIGNLAEMYRVQMEKKQGAGLGAKPVGKVIDLCPKCGKMLSANHRCK